MKSINKAAWLAALEQQVEGHIQQAVERFQNMDETTLSQPSQSGGWSIAQCLDHLNSYGHYYLPRLKQGLITQLDKPVTDSVDSSWLGNFLTRLMDPKTGKQKFRAIKRHQPTEAWPAHQVVAEFIDQQEQLLEVLRQAEKVNINGVQIPLSIAPWLHLPVGDILHFMVVHTERHMLQANRNLASV
ncbi:DinB family protein [Spirosoma jeollabukense]